ncbi:MAG: MoaD/ThiS family protein, partial [Deltaproteobacteria bacterium]|nr:MoaD/ThiS family protein [Deltaproteobacteria bacterium]
MDLTVKLFGAVRERVGAKLLSLSLPDGSSVADLRARLAAEHAVFDDFGDRLAVSINFEIADPDATLHDGDEVAFLPPVSGGTGLCTLSAHPLDVAATIARV